MLSAPIEEQISRFNSLNEWFNSIQGRHIAQAIAAELTCLDDVLSGSRLIQLGACGDNVWLASLRYRHKWLIAPQIHNSTIDCSADLQQLPIDRNSLDCILAPFVVDAFNRTEGILDEIDRILKPMGYVVIFGFHYFSLWGIWLKFWESCCFGVYGGFPRSSFTLRRSMFDRGYIQCYCNNFYFIPPVRKQYLLNKLSFLNSIGKMVTPMPSALYCLVMQKHVENHISPSLTTNSIQVNLSYT
ncbi:MAG: hypothetical protein A3F46_05805 [Legionellales bacterium RIFCSPHIGHO2_12_FULL_42_9]|nr:MAG: hypothetical protein A3F46_05805 [Legionellales bacterium RIFCSPHIGHO2_12_FULL_42_9]